MDLCSHTRISFAILSKSLKSWETTTHPPVKALENVSKCQYAIIRVVETYVDGISERVDSGDIQSVGRLIEQEHVGTVNCKLEMQS